MYVRACVRACVCACVCVCLSPLRNIKEKGIVSTYWKCMPMIEHCLKHYIDDRLLVDAEGPRQFCV